MADTHYKHCTSCKYIELNPDDHGTSLFGRCKNCGSTVLYTWFYNEFPHLKKLSNPDKLNE